MIRPHDANQPEDARPPEKPTTPEKARHRPATGVPAILSQSPTPLNLLRCLRRRLFVALCIGVFLGALAGVGTWFLAPAPKHLVRSYIRVPVGTPYLVRTSEAIPDIVSHQRTQIALCKSRPVLNTALGDPDVVNLSIFADKLEPVMWLEKEVTVDFNTAPEIMRIAMNGVETSSLVALVNAIQKAYIRDIADNEITARKQRQSFLLELIQKYEDQLREARRTQKEAAELAGAKSPDGRERILSFHLQQLGMQERELLTTEMELPKARLKLDELEAQEKSFEQLKIPESAILEALAKDQEILTLKAQIQERETKIVKYVQLAAQGEKAVAVIRWREEIVGLNSKISEANNRLREKIIKNLRERARIELLASITFQQGRIANLKSMKEMLDPEIVRSRDRVKVVNKQGYKLDIFEDEIGHLQDMTKNLKGQSEALKVELQAPSRVRVVEPAAVIRVDVKLRKILMTGGACLAGLVFALFGIAWLEYRSRRVDQVEEVVHGLGMKLVGTVPRVAPVSRANTGKSSKGDETAQQLLIDSVDATRTLLLHLARSHALRTVMVSSAMSGEGKTSLSCRLGVSLARAGLRTLLIDADTHNPSVHKVFGGSCDPGFCDVLCGNTDASSSLRAAPVSNLFFMPAGHWSEQLAAVLDKGEAGVLFKQLSQEFDIILVDSPPILPVADALQIGQQVDGVILSVLCHVSRLNLLHSAAQRLEELNIRTMGVVINGVQGQLYGAKYAYTHAYRTKAKA
jgi:succinoglycan biosynthesis transport protein ExoP